MSGAVQEVSSTIRDIVAACGRLPGSRLSAALKERLPEWSPAGFGSRSLRELISTNVHLIQFEAGANGVDPVERCLGGNAFFPLAPVQRVVANLQLEVFGNFVLVDDLADAYSDLISAAEAAISSCRE